MITDIYVKERYANDDLTGGVIDRRVFFSKESFETDLKLTRMHYGGVLTSVAYFKGAVERTPLDINKELFNG